MAIAESAYSFTHVSMRNAPPFWPVSVTGPMCLCDEVSNAPPIECMELAVEPRRVDW